MKKVFITGISGFVGSHAVEYFNSLGKNYRIYGIAKHGSGIKQVDEMLKKKATIYTLSMLDNNRLAEALSAVNPDYIIHLACLSSVAFSWHEPRQSFLNNTNIFLNLLEVVRKLKMKCRILSIGSSEEYGVMTKSCLPVRETAVLRPSSPYAVARVAQEQLSTLYAKAFKLPIICTRSFNHIGPRQDSKFVISSFAKQAVEIKKGKRKVLNCGDIEIIRDLIDVRDVVRAYHLLLKNGEPGEVYNVCSGKGYRLAAIIKIIGNILQTKLPIAVNAGLHRPVDNPVIIGSPQKLIRTAGFKLKFENIQDSLKDIINFWDERT